MMISVEVARRVIDQFGLGFTEGFVLRRIQSGELQRVPKPYNGIYDSKYGFGVSTESLAQLLISHGVTEEEIQEVLPV
ncbi:hypothetical protein [Heyndrickxia oleronia]|uniref:hypothetical protein n=1 Tax=Heyndrickxia oleronia TaxID=38875 RepID=UPI003F84C22E